MELSFLTKNTEANKMPLVRLVVDDFFNWALLIKRLQLDVAKLHGHRWAGVEL